MPPNTRILITGFGLVTPLGLGAWETFSALLAGRTLSDRAERLPSDIAPVDLVRALGGVVVAQHATQDPAIDLAERAAREALFMAGVNTGHGEDPIPAILGVSKGAVVAMSRAAGVNLTEIKGGYAGKDAAAKRKAGSDRLGMGGLINPKYADAHAMGPVGYLAHHLQHRLNIGDITTTVAACASSLTAVHQARQRLLHETGPDGHPGPKRILVVTSEAALLPMFIHSYERLGVLPVLAAEQYAARPLDERRSGFMLAELAAAVVLEVVPSPESGVQSRETKKHPTTQPPVSSTLDSGQNDSGLSSLVELVTTAIACEGHDLIRAAPGMPALRRVAEDIFGVGHVDVLHPHATGTPENDAAELAVYEESLTQRRSCASSTLDSGQNDSGLMPSIYASKGALGHGLGASGLVSLVLACLSAKSGRVPPMPWLERPIATQFPIKSGSRTLNRTSTHAVFAAGFGGHVAGAAIRRVAR
ncbi:MAG: hypothetical protein K8S99_03000 [Planctomycetes bacterium]|nr:hypothetical protein [Planctomycetota bacterium]